jgi:hypothetical protein
MLLPFSDALSQSFTYENVWDSDKIKGCKCDNMLDSYDCGLRLCPNGDDPLTVGQVMFFSVTSKLSSFSN